MNDFGIVHLKDEKFDTSQGDMQLLIKITPRRISYAIIDARDNSLVVLHDSPISDSIENSLNDLSRDNEDFQLTFTAVKASVHTPNFTLIPTKYFTFDNMPEYEKLMQANGKSKTFISSINSDTIKCIKALNVQTTTPIINTLSGVRLFSQIEPLVEMGLKMGDTNPNKLLLQFGVDFFEACLISDEKLILYNLYQIKNTDDFNYYLLMIMEQLSINNKNTSVILAGNIEHGDESHSRVAKYFGDVRFADCTEIIKFSNVFDQSSKHRHLSLLGLLLCE
ncbi:DUF3822 family protein [Pedobacter sp. P351]|uniref:DUF3822 family protein n=1 Tax=Pedobacter superstes TaxID=3133441 RepID=UPI0030A374FE